jgi:hypothetical protein
MRVVYQDIVGQILDACRKAEQADRKIERIYLTEDELKSMRFSPFKTGPTPGRSGFGYNTPAGAYAGTCFGVEIWRDPA